MRLDTAEVDAIRRAARQAFGTNATVRLFGSRADDTRRGGDIDLHVEVDEVGNESAMRAQFENALFAQIEEQRVDVVLQRRGRPPAAIDLVAVRDGIIL